MYTVLSPTKPLTMWKKRKRRRRKKKTEEEERKNGAAGIFVHGRAVLGCSCVSNVEFFFISMEVGSVCIHLSSLAAFSEVCCTAVGEIKGRTKGKKYQGHC